MSSESVGLARTDRRSTQRERLIAGMVMAARRHGYAGATVSEVIERAGVSRPTFYEYFEDRDACFIAAHRELATRFVERIRETVEAAPAEQAVQVGIRRFIELAEEHPNGASFLCDSTMAGGWGALDAHDRLIDELAHIIERVARSGATRRPHPRRARTTCVGSVALAAGSVVSWRRSGSLGAGRRASPIGSRATYARTRDTAGARSSRARSCHRRRTSLTSLYDLHRRSRWGAPRCPKPRSPATSANGSCMRQPRWRPPRATPSPLSPISPRPPALTAVSSTSTFATSNRRSWRCTSCASSRSWP